MTYLHQALTNSSCSRSYRRMLTISTSRGRPRRARPCLTRSPSSTPRAEPWTTRAWTSRQRSAYLCLGFNILLFYIIMFRVSSPPTLTSSGSTSPARERWPSKWRRCFRWEDTYFKSQMALFIEQKNCARWFSWNTFYWHDDKTFRTFKPIDSKFKRYK